MRIAKLYILITALFLSFKSHSWLEVTSITASSITLKGRVYDSDFMKVTNENPARRLLFSINTENDRYIKNLNTVCNYPRTPAEVVNDLLSSGVKIPYAGERIEARWYVIITCKDTSTGYTWWFGEDITPPDSNCSINVSAVNFGTIPYNETGIVTTIPVSLSCNKAFSAKLEFQPKSLTTGIILLDDAKVAPYFDNGKTTVTLSSTSGFETVSLNFRLTDTGKKMGIKKGSVVLLASFE